MQNVVKVMKALSDPNRVAIVLMLTRRELCACEMVPRLGLAQPTVSRHLKILVDAGLILARREGIWTHYRLPETGGAQAGTCVATLLANLPQWLGHDAGLRALVEDLGEENPCLAKGATRCGGDDRA
ncbi:MAG: hypothetical protein AUJ49_04375 [Desulfovibrionaceae bacterium CG1_02_65_16]|nr:MAG: hypothetical protein AUJ49_04375 [Desulfovibrionaceae bacterium CG1_02_65_16]